MPEGPQVSIREGEFLARLQILVFSLLLVILLLNFLRNFQDILQPLFIAVFLGLVIMPLRDWIVARGVVPLAASLALLVVILTVFFSLGVMVYRNLEFLSDRLPGYSQILERRYESLLQNLPADWRSEVETFVRESQLLSGEKGSQVLRSVLGTFFNFFTGLGITAIYLIFLMAERASFPHRILHAFGEHQGGNILRIMNAIHRAITQYMSVKTFSSVLAGFLSYLLLRGVGVDFALTWGVLTCLLNFIPYLGSLIATVLPILMAVAQFDDSWKVFATAGGLIVIQQVIGMVLEPRMAGNRLGVSPLLILLSLSFWFLVWGVVGAILAVPLLVIIKITLENIDATRPLATLMSYF